MKPVLACVDDNAINLEFYKDLLSDRFDVDTYQNSVDFALKVNEKEYDCYIFDVQMPILNGFHLLEKIRNHPQKKNIPVFIITSSLEDSVRLESYKGGATDFLDRSLKTEELLVRIESRIENYRFTNHLLKLGNLQLNHKTVDCFVNREKLVLTLIEFKILSIFVQDFPARISKSALISKIWGKDTVNANNLNTHLYNLRLKLATWNYELKHDRRDGFGLELKTPENSQV